MTTGAEPLYPDVTLAVLCWHGADSLSHTLGSYSAENLYDLLGRSFIYSQEADPDVKTVTSGHNIDLIENAANLGILGGMTAMAEEANTDFILFTENDCALIEPRENVIHQIGRSLNLLKQEKAVMARLRHRTFPGQAFRTYDKYMAHFHRKPAWQRMLQPGKSARLTGTAVYAETQPDLKYPSDITAAGDDTFLVSARVMPWTNQSILVSREVFLQQIVPFCQASKETRGANGFKNVEVELNNSRFWRNSGWQVACPPGLFTHQRFEYRGYEAGISNKPVTL